MAEEEFIYSGKANLENSEVLQNFQRFLTSELQEFFGNCEETLDFGAGIGTYSRIAANLGKKVHCVEKDGEFQEILRKQGFAAYDSLEKVDRKFSHIFTINVLEHIEDDVAILKELRSKLTDDGKIYIFVPASQILYSKFDENVAHFRRYSRKELLSKLEQAGFTIEHSRCFDWVGFFCNLYFKYFGSKSGVINSDMMRIYDKYLLPLSLSTDFLFARLFHKNLIAVAHK